jgi:hypothetical protein
MEYKEGNWRKLLVDFASEDKKFVTVTQHTMAMAAFCVKVVVLWDWNPYFLEIVELVKIIKSFYPLAGVHVYCFI